MSIIKYDVSMLDSEIRKPGVEVTCSRLECDKRRTVLFNSVVKVELDTTRNGVRVFAPMLPSVCQFTACGEGLAFTDQVEDIATILENVPPERIVTGVETPSTPL
jgi:hypothetical protein